MRIIQIQAGLQCVRPEMLHVVALVPQAVEQCDGERVFRGTGRIIGWFDAGDERGLRPAVHGEQAGVVLAAG